MRLTPFKLWVFCSIKRLYLDFGHLVIGKLGLNFVIY